MAVAGADRVTVYSPRVDPASPSALNGVVHTDHHGAIGHKPFDDHAEQAPGDGTRTPTGAIEDLVIGREVGGVGPAGHPQAGTHGPFARCQQGAHDQDKYMLPAWRREASTPCVQPLPQYLRDGIADNGFGMVLHPMLRILVDTACKANALAVRRGESDVP
jgi:hypothetical protein